MLSYSIGMDSIPEETLKLFSELKNGEEYDCCYEVIMSDLEGKIDRRSKFNLKAFALKIKTNEKYSGTNYYKKRVRLDDEENPIEIEDEKNTEDEAIFNLEKSSLIENYDEIISYCYRKHFIDIEHTLEMALQGVAPAIETLKTLTQKDEVVHDFVKMYLELRKRY